MSSQSRLAKEKALLALKDQALAEEDCIAKAKAFAKKKRKLEEDEENDWPAEGIIQRRPYDETTDEVLVKWAGFHWYVNNLLISF